MEREYLKPGNMLYPVPVVMVSCSRDGEKPNIITVAWAGTVCSDPAMVSISIRKNRHSHGIIKETGEFVINLVSGDLVRACDLCGVRSGRDTDKFDLTGLTPSVSREVKAPGIAECPVSIECRVKEVLELGSHEMFLAEVVAVSVDRRLMDEQGVLHLEQADLVAYNHGGYFALGECLGTFGYSVKKVTASKGGRAKKPPVQKAKMDTAPQGGKKQQPAKGQDRPPVQKDAKGGKAPSGRTARRHGKADGKPQGKPYHGNHNGRGR